MRRTIVALIVGLALVGCEDPGALQTNRPAINSAPVTNTEVVPGGELRETLPVGTQGFKSLTDLQATPLDDVTYDLDHCENGMCLITVTSGSHTGEQYWIQEANRYRFN